MMPIEPIGPGTPRNDVAPIQPAPPGWKVVRDRRRQEEERRRRQAPHRPLDEEPSDDDGLPHVDVGAERPRAFFPTCQKPFVPGPMTRGAPRTGPMTAGMDARRRDEKPFFKEEE